MKMLIKEKKNRGVRKKPLWKISLHSLHIVYPDMNCDIFNTAHILSLQSATDFLLDEIQLHLNCLAWRCKFVQLGLQAPADTRGGSIPWDKMDSSFKWSKAKYFITVLLELLALYWGGNNPTAMREIVYFPELWLHASCRFGRTLLYLFCLIPMSSAGSELEHSLTSRGQSLKVPHKFSRRAFLK